MTHLLVDISAHGLGHLAQTAPVVNRLMQLRPHWRLTVRSGLSSERLQQRLTVAFEYIHAASDFGFVMHNAIDIDYVASAARYQETHADWPQRVASEAACLRALQVDAVLSNVAYLPLAAAARLGIPAAGMCSLNWAELFLNCFRDAVWAPAIYAEILDAYRAADVFLRVSPGMAMEYFPRQRPIGPIARVATPDNQRRSALAIRIGLPEHARWVLVAMGGMAFRQPIERWPHVPDLFWLVPQDWGVERADVRCVEQARLDFTELLATVDAVLTKPGYGTFVEAACCGTPVMYVGRDDWPEELPLAQWLAANTRATKVTRAELAEGALAAALASIFSQPAPPKPVPTGIDEATTALLTLFDRHASG